MNFKKYINESVKEPPNKGEFNSKEDAYKWFSKLALGDSSKIDLYNPDTDEIYIMAGTTVATAARKIPELDKLVSTEKKARQDFLDRAAYKRDMADLNKAPKLSDADMWNVARKLEATWGEVFPDGDPSDTMIPYLKKKFNIQNDYIKILDKAAKMIGGNYVKGYHDWLAKAWEDTVADFPEYKKGGNPWK